MTFWLELLALYVMCLTALMAALWLISFIARSLKRASEAVQQRWEVLRMVKRIRLRVILI